MNPICAKMSNCGQLWSNTLEYMQTLMCAVNYGHCHIVHVHFWVFGSYFNILRTPLMHVLFSLVVIICSPQ